MFETLFAKTFLILGSQLLITFLGAIAILKYLRHLYRRNFPGITATRNARGELDLIVDNALFQPYVWPLLIAYFVLFLVLLIFGRSNLSIGIPVFSLWSLVMGANLAIGVVRIDENFAARVLGITFSIAFICALIGIYSGIDFSFLNGILFFALLALLLAYTIRLFIKIPGEGKRFTAFFGVLIFIGYLLVDFNRLEQLQAAGNNTWSAAIDLAISIYLDIINLFLQLLELLGESS